jgi:hypothetical protein
VQLFYLDSSPVYVQTSDPADYSNVAVNYLDADFMVHEEHFKTFPSESLIILDDFQLRTKNDKANFLRVINYVLRHQHITLFLIIHNLFGNFLFTDVLYASHLFLSCSNIGRSILSKIHSRLGANVMTFYNNEPKINFQFMYINSKKNYLINNVQQLFGRHPIDVKMFTNQQQFVIHLAGISCGKSESSNTLSQTIASEVNELISTLYPKQKSLQLVTKKLLKYNAINEDLNFTSEPNVHLADFLRFINNSFDKNTKPNVNILKLCRKLQAEQIRLPNVCVKNPHAKRYFC